MLLAILRNVYASLISNILLGYLFLFHFEIGVLSNSIYKSLVSYMYWQYLLLLWVFIFYFLQNAFWWAEFKNFNVTQLTTFSLKVVCVCVCVSLRNLLQDHENISLKSFLTFRLSFTRSLELIFKYAAR